MAEFEIGGKAYRSAKMDAFSQFHVMRKLAPIFAGLDDVSAILSAVRGGDDGGEPRKAVGAIAKVISDMPEADMNTILSRCCAVTSRQVGAAGYAPIWNEQAARLMYDDIEWLDLVQIVARVIQDNLGNFSAAPLSA